jgi:hypothetical protein
MFFTLAGQRIENVVHFTNTSGWGTDEQAALGNAVNVWWNGFMQPLLSQELVYRFSQVTDLRTADGPVIPVVPDAPIPGAIGTNALPNNCALCVAFSSGGRGRSSRGRNYVAGITEADAAASVVEGTKAEAIRLAYDSLRTFVPGEVPGFVWTIVSRTLAGVPRVPPVALPVLSVYLSDTVIDSQRRRLPRRGS